MEQVLQFALLGLGAGAIYALLGHGLVLIFRGSGILNLAHGAFAMAGAYFYYEIHVLHSVGLWPSLVATVIASGLLGVVVDQLLLRRLRRASALARLIATMGVFLVIVSAGTLRYGATSLLASPIFPRKPVHVLGTVVPSDQLWLFGLVVLVTLVLATVWRFTRVGWVMAAVSENPRAAAAQGWSPQRVSALTWGVGAGFAGLAGVLIAPITQLSVTTLALTVIPALVAALFGGFRSFVLTLIGGLVLGVGESLVGRYVDFVGASSALPVVLLLIVLFLRGSTLPLRGYVSDRLPDLGRGGINPRFAVPAFVIAAGILQFVASDNWLSASMVCLSVSIILLSLVVVAGYAGQLSLAQYALAGIGALVAARAVSSLHLTFVLALLVGVVGSALAGLLMALPAVRTRGVNLAVLTLALGLAIQQLLFNNVSIIGTGAGTNVGSPTLFGWSIDAFDHPTRYALFALVMFSLCAAGVANLRRGRAGRRLIATRTNEKAAAAMGINVVAAKLHAFAVGGALAGLGGILLAFQSSTVVYAGFDPVSSMNAVATTVIGGIGYVLAPVVGAVLAPGSLGQTAFLNVQSIQKDLPIIGAIGLLLALLLDPNGLVNNVIRAFRKVVPRRSFDLNLDDSSVQRVKPKTLRVQSLTVEYGAVKAVDDVSFSIRPGEVVGLIGPNGAGKTSVIDGISGFTRALGSVVLDGEDVSSWRVHRRARAGMVRSFQSLELLEDVSVLENLQAASDRRDWRALVTDLVNPGRPALPPIAVAAVREFGLDDVLHQRPPELSYGQRRLVAVARAVAGAPSVLLLDEPVAGLDDGESREFASLVRRLADEWGMAVLVIEHDMEFVMGLCDRIHVLDRGRPIADGAPADIRQDEHAIAAYLGTESEPDEALL